MERNSHTRLRKLQEIAEQLRRKETVAKRKLETWLEQDYDRVEEQWAQQLQLRE
jgi:hypothetical protein